MKRIAKEQKADQGEEQIERVRRLCLALPGSWEKISHGEPTWFVGKKVFAISSLVRCPNFGFVLSFAGVRTIHESHENRTNKPRFRLWVISWIALLGKAIS